MSKAELSSDMSKIGAVGAFNDACFSVKLGFTRSQISLFVARVRTKEIQGLQLADFSKIIFFVLLIVSFAVSENFEGKGFFRK